LIILEISKVCDVSLIRIKDKWRVKNSLKVNLKMPSICNILSPVSRRPCKVPIIGRPAPTVAS
jgi:hypothetical protein